MSWNERKDTRGCPFRRYPPTTWGVPRKKSYLAKITPSSHPSDLTINTMADAKQSVDLACPVVQRPDTAIYTQHGGHLEWFKMADHLRSWKGEEPVKPALEAIRVWVEVGFKWDTGRVGVWGLLNLICKFIDKMWVLSLGCKRDVCDVFLSGYWSRQSKIDNWAQWNLRCPINHTINSMRLLDVCPRFPKQRWKIMGSAYHYVPSKLNKSNEWRESTPLHWLADEVHQ